MFLGRFRAVLGLLAFASFSLAFPAQLSAAAWQCVTYARHVSEVEIRGNAHTWWAQAEGRYERGSAPAVGSVMVMRPHGAMRLGHVAMVREIVGDREIRLNHANWSGRGVVDADVLAIDVSPNNDWSEVRVWYSPIGALGTSVYPVYGFIYPEAPQPRTEMVEAADEPTVVLASAAAPAHGGMAAPVTVDAD